MLSNLSMLESGKAALPYTLTRSQEKVLLQILEDIQSPAPMMRLLQVPF